MGLGTLIIIALGVILYLIGMIQLYFDIKRKDGDIHTLALFVLCITLGAFAMYTVHLLIEFFTYLNQFRI